MAHKVWSQFQVAREDGSILKLRIQDLPEDRFEEAVDLFINFVYEETFHKAAGVRQNPKAVEHSRQTISEFMKEPMAHNTICVVEDEDGNMGQIVGISSTYLVVNVDELEELFKQTELETETKTLIKLMSVMSKAHKVLEGLQISRFYDDRGLYIHSGFRKLGIATEFLKTRRLACIAYNIPATTALMTSISTQKIALRDGWETVLEINLDDLGKQHGVNFEERISKFMIWRNPQLREE